jgi:cysteine synthase A
MKIRKAYQTIADAVELPHVVQLADNLYGAAFFLMKLIPARFILDHARRDGFIEPCMPIIETTSGTFGLALAILSALHDYRLILVSDPAIDLPLLRRMEDLGTRVEIVLEPAPVGGYQRARLDRMAELQVEFPNHFWPSQYDNPHNPGAYAPFVELLVESIGQIDCVVGAVGSGGSLCGTSSFLRVLFPHLHVIGVDTHGSVLFGQPDQKRMLRGLGNSLMPKNMDHTLFDEVHWVSAAEAFNATRELHRSKALYMGGTSGAAYMVARWYAKQHPDANVVVLLPDEGYRYESTIYSDDWLREQGVWLKRAPTEPIHVTLPWEATNMASQLQGKGVWSHMNWKRRSYQEVVGTPFEAEVLV